jgi:acyl carrier protein
MPRGVGRPRSGHGRRIGSDSAGFEEIPGRRVDSRPLFRSRGWRPCGAAERTVRRIQKVASVKDRVIDIVASQLGVSKDQITLETSFINDLGADSLDTVELVMELEEEFEINIPDDAAEKIQTVGQAVEFIEKHQS